MMNQIKQSWSDYWHKAFQYSGYSSIFDFWTPVIINFVILLLFQVCTSLDANIGNGSITKLISVVSLLYIVVSLVPLISNGYRRFSDVGFPSYYYFAVLAIYIISCLYPILWFRLLMMLVFIVSASSPTGEFHNVKLMIK